MERKLICSDCNMVFRSTGLFHKHKTLFCVWGEVGHLLPDKPECVDPTDTKTPELRVPLGGQRRIMTGGRNVDAEPKSARAEDGPAAGQTGNATLQDLAEEFHKLRMSIEEKLPIWSTRPADAEGRANQLRHRERLEEMKGMAIQLDLIHANSQQLEQQRDELAHQVSILSKQSSATHQGNLLEELREQGERNEETLQQLAEHLHALRALWRAYIQSGGSDPAIVAQMIELQVEAQSLEKQPAVAGNQAMLPGRSLSRELLAVEQENRRLEEEILRLQLARGQRHDAESVISQLEQIQRDNLLQISSLQAEMERTTAPLRLRGPPPHPRPLQTKTHTHAPLSTLQVGSFSPPLGVGRMVDPLGPAPYDPTAGFVAFYDLVLGLDAAHKAFQLAAGLYSDGQEVEALPPLRCLPLTHSRSSGNSAVLSVRHPIPRVQPSPSLSLVVEVQAGADPDVRIHQVLKLERCGWARLELFDQYNQLRSGHWRAPVRHLPVKPSLNVAQLNSVPQLGNMELCLRLVNGRDAAVQTLAPINPTSSPHYEYPAVPNATPQGASPMQKLPI
ncbi:coiled-coil domain-containing protein 17-like [Brachionichthys hirsutus]|uniref:coiled-coil domain-containing protein 17-like n=1 Tax=Brachionichthys hirsutus TaxID=412623 RepID=UPI003605044F